MRCLDGRLQVILPNIFVPDSDLIARLFFTAGPAPGGDNWQQQACRLIHDRIRDCVVAVPIKYKEGHPLLQHRLSGYDNHYPGQLEWETDYLKRASQPESAYRPPGGILFWLPTPVDYEQHGSHFYAKNTLREIWEWRMRLKENPRLRVVFGGEEGFPNWDEVVADIRRDLGADWPIYPTLDEVVDAVINLP